MRDSEALFEIMHGSKHGDGTVDRGVGGIDSARSSTATKSGKNVGFQPRLQGPVTLF